jgi:prepilin-type processing-associated H-X9-DG protein
MPILVTCECGKQFQAKDENVGRRFNCPNCDREVMVPKPDANPYYEPTGHPIGPVKTSGNAIASLVLGILSVILCLCFTGIPAIICGILGISRIGKSGGRLEGKGLAIAGIVTGSIGTLFTLMIIPFMAALLIPAVQAGRGAAQRAQCVNNLKQIGLALHNYHSTYGAFPPSASVDANGKPLLSWRVAILPFMEESGVYSQFKLDEPWDSPNNIKLLSQMPKAFGCPADGAVGSTTTRYQGIVGPGAAFEGTKGLPIASFTDGTSNTVIAVEAETPVEWTKPDDVALAEVLTALGSSHPGGANILMTDGAVRFLNTEDGPNGIKTMSTRAGGEVLGPGSP